MKEYKVVAINLGSTSTKIAYYINDVCQISTSLAHDPAQLAACKDIWEQYGLRKDAVAQFLAENHISLDELDAFSSRAALRTHRGRYLPDQRRLPSAEP